MSITATDDQRQATLTILRAKVAQTKTNRLKDGKFVQDGYGGAGWVAPIVAHVTGIDELFACLNQLAASLNDCVVRGKPRRKGKWGNRRWKPRTNVETGAIEEPSLDPCAQSWAMLDCDMGKCPEGVDAAVDAKAYAREAVRMLQKHVPEARGVSVIVQLSASAGTPKGEGKLKAHLWYLLDKPLDDASLKRWAKHVNRSAGFKLIEPPIFQPQQPHYTAAPICKDGWIEPLDKRLFLFRGANEALSLTIPDAPPEPARQIKGKYEPRATGDWEPDPDYRGLSWETVLDTKLGYENEAGEGFNTPLFQAAIRAAYRRVDPDTFRERAAQAIEDNQGDRDAYNEYVDGGKLDETIESAWRIAAEARAADERERDRLWKEDEKARRERALRKRENLVNWLIEIEVTLALQTVLDWLARPEGPPPMIIIRASTASGKTRQMLAEIARLIGHRINWYTYTTELQRETLEKYQGQKPNPRIPGFEIRGRGAADDDARLIHVKSKQNWAMCHRHKMAATIAEAGLPVFRNLCAACKEKTACGYNQQYADLPKNAVVFLAHAYLRFKPYCGKGDFAVIDESPFNALFADRTFDRAILKNQGRLSIMATATNRNQAADDIWLARDREAIIGRAAAVMHASLRKGRLTDKAALEAAVELLDADQINLYGGNTDIAIAGRMDRLAAVDRAGFRALLATALASKNLTDDIQVERDENNGEKIVFRDFSIPRAVEGVPVIVLDATARPEVYAEAFGGRFQIHDCRIPETAKLTQIVCSGSRWTLFGKNPYAPDEKLSPESRAARRARVARILQRCCERAAGRSMVLFAPQAFIDYVRERPDLMPEGAAIEMAHFNSFRGLNKFKELGFAAIVGRNLPAVAAMERDRAAMARKTGSTPITVDGYERQHRPNVAKPDHGYLGTPLQPRHPDPVTEGLRYNVAEGEAIQAGGRLRSLRRDDELEILSVHGLDLSEGFGREPDETIQWSRFMQFGKTALAQYIERCFDELESVPLGPVDMVTLAPDLFENEQAAKDALRNAGDFGGYASGRYWREGQRKPSRFLRPHGFTGARCEQLLRQALGCCVRVEI